ncbi:MAG: hypothetical protein HYR60_10105 [Acidobacteria bacterium]|nr:hypothetical protein [Acidobacteriota bacterium]
MTEPNDENLRKLLRMALPPSPETRLERDLWPRMLQRLDQAPAGLSRLDWALAALLPVWFFLFPNAIPGLLYHL